MIIFVCRECNSARIRIKGMKFECRECGKELDFHSCKYAETRDVYDKIVITSSGMTIAKILEGKDGSKALTFVSDKEPSSNLSEVFPK